MKVLYPSSQDWKALLQQVPLFPRYVGIVPPTGETTIKSSRAVSEDSLDQIGQKKLYKQK